MSGIGTKRPFMYPIYKDTRKTCQLNFKQVLTLIKLLPYFIRVYLIVIKKEIKNKQRFKTKWVLTDFILQDK